MNNNMACNKVLKIMKINDKPSETLVIKAAEQKKKKNVWIKILCVWELWCFKSWKEKFVEKILQKEKAFIITKIQFFIY